MLFILYFTWLFSVLLQVTSSPTPAVKQKRAFSLFETFGLSTKSGLDWDSSKPTLKTLGDQLLISPQVLEQTLVEYNPAIYALVPEIIVSEFDSHPRLIQELLKFDKLTDFQLEPRTRDNYILTLGQWIDIVEMILQTPMRDITSAHYLHEWFVKHEKELQGYPNKQELARFFDVLQQLEKHVTTSIQEETFKLQDDSTPTHSLSERQAFLKARVAQFGRATDLFLLMSSSKEMASQFLSAIDLQVNALMPLVMQLAAKSDPLLLEQILDYSLLVHWQSLEQPVRFTYVLSVKEFEEFVRYVSFLNLVTSPATKMVTDFLLKHTNDLIMYQPTSVTSRIYSEVLYLATRNHKQESVVALLSSPKSKELIGQKEVAPSIAYTFETDDPSLFYVLTKEYHGKGEPLIDLLNHCEHEPKTIIKLILSGEIPRNMFRGKKDLMLSYFIHRHWKDSLKEALDHYNLFSTMSADKHDLLLEQARVDFELEKILLSNEDFMQHVSDAHLAQLVSTSTYQVQRLEILLKQKATLERLPVSVLSNLFHALTDTICSTMSFLKLCSNPQLRETLSHGDLQSLTKLAQELNVFLPHTELPEVSSPVDKKVDMYVQTHPVPVSNSREVESQVDFKQAQAEKVDQGTNTMEHVEAAEHNLHGSRPSSEHTIPVEPQAARSAKGVSPAELGSKTLLLKQKFKEMSTRSKWILGFSLLVLVAFIISEEASYH